jgi:hypothetical protein
VEQIVRIIHEMAHEPATLIAARAMRGLLGGNRAEF